MAKRCGALFFVAVLIALPSTAWCRDGTMLGQPQIRREPISAPDRNNKASTARPVTLRREYLGNCLSWGEGDRPILEACNGSPEQLWYLDDTRRSTTISTGAGKCLTVCVDGRDACHPFHNREMTAVNLTDCAARPAPDSQLWTLSPYQKSGAVEMICVQTGTCLEGAMLVNKCVSSGLPWQLWHVSHVAADALSGSEMLLSQ